MRETQQERMVRIRADIEMYKSNHPRILNNYAKGAIQRTHQISLGQFWKSFRRCKTTEDCLELLRKMTTTRVVSVMPAVSHKQMRESFKGKKFWGSLCECCGAKAEHRHHIIPLSRGGRNKDKNLIMLCAWCHAQVHPWMEQPLIKPESMAETLARVEREP